MTINKHKYRCTDCDWRGIGEDLLTAENPFNKSDTIVGCPGCKLIDVVLNVCDEGDCWEFVTNGMVDGGVYRNRCSEHGGFKNSDRSKK